MRGNPWTPAEDKIVLANTNTEDCIAELAEHGYCRTGAAILSRRKALMKGKASTAQLNDERAQLEVTLIDLEQRLKQTRKRLLEVRFAQVRDAAGDIDLPQEVYDEIRKRLTPD